MLKRVFVYVSSGAQGEEGGPCVSAPVSVCVSEPPVLLCVL